MRIVSLLAELNELEIMSCDIGNAYLTAYTSEKVYTVGGPELGELEGHTLIIEKALYGLRTSAASFAHSLADTLRNEGFVPSHADENVWMRDAGDVYEYICVWADDLLCAMKQPSEFMVRLQSDPYNYKLKGMEEPRYHLGGDFWRDPDGTLAFGAKTYIKRMVDNYEMMFGEKPKPVVSPLEKNDHPELDNSAFCSPEDTAKYQSLIGALQWTISLCRFDIAVAVMTLGRYRAAPLVGHLERVKRVCGYLRKYPDAAIRFRTGIPDHSEAAKQIVDYDWMYSVYGNVQEELPRNMPTPKGKMVRTTTYKDANLYHDYTTGRAVTGVLHFLNQTPIDWTAKRQGTVETATYGSEFTSARTATEQIIDLRFTLRMFGVPLDGPAWLFGDNQSVVTSSTLPHSSLNKRHNALSYHRVREAVACKILYFLHMDGKQNPSDALSKFLPHYVFWPLLEPILFSRGETKRKDELRPGTEPSS
jgi:hypothetical protein